MYPIILWNDLIAFGAKKTPDPKGEFFFVQDFPLERKDSTDSPLPHSLVIQPEEILPLPSPPKEKQILAKHVNYAPSYLEWEKNVLLAQKDSLLEKVILARRHTFFLKETIDPIALFFMLKKIPQSHPFAFILSPDTAFLGATPELLYYKENLKLKTEALAATRPLHEEHLLYQEKEMQEFAFVKKELTKKLSKIAHPFSIDTKLHSKKTRNLVHLHYPFEVTLRKEISNKALIDYLHPTPAIAGTPTKKALSFIATHEPFDRTWYAGCIGHSKGNKSNVFVAIRSFLLHKQTVHLFTGAGITKDSSPQKEWEELHLKEKSFSPFMIF